ncbi:hypothetical protein B6U99_07650 [Candidatus Geothermarchaeota archaeon ex4572_27]|nr:MAG: hypothetical protein B6U99_07650 [Candidatus Geothermarchaeota archaeon ex4572_27]
MRGLARLAVYASCAKDYYTIVGALRRRGLPFLSLTPDRRLPRWVRVVVVPSRDAGKLSLPPEVKLIEVEGDDVELIPIKAKLALQGKELFAELLVGIDPGETCGLAVLGDLDLVDYGVYRDVGRLKRYLDLLLGASLSRRTLIRVGGGSPKHRDRVLSALPSLRGVEVEVVDESQAVEVLPMLIEGVPRDVASAVRIALKRGSRLRLNE